MRHFRLPIWCCWTLMVTATACVPMTVATTAQPVPQGETAPVLIWYSITNGIEVMRDSGSIAWLGVDAEGRVGVSDRADVGVRIPSGIRPVKRQMNHAKKTTMFTR